jgi:tRNA dimethylallyltransferase
MSGNKRGGQASGQPKLLAVIGPTAAGKTALAIELAKAFNGEIISADSRQFYRGTAIGTDIIEGKWVKRGGRRVYMAHGVPHHLIAFRSPNQPVTLDGFRRLARRRIKEIAARGRLPILCGGTGLYVQAVTDNFSLPSVPPNLDLRAKLERRSTTDLFSELKRRDSEYAARISPGNRRYIIRALEVIEATGRRFSAQQAKGEPEYDVLKLGVRRPREMLYRKIDQRVDEMMEEGLVKETERLVKRHGWATPAMTGLGHRQIGQYLRGEISLAEAVRLIKRDTRHYARRQLIWWRRDSAIKWVRNLSEAKRLVSRFKGKNGG